MTNSQHSHGTDRDLLMKRAYATENDLATRQRIHREYSVPQIDFARWVTARVEWRGDESILDVGSGSGMYRGALMSRAPKGRYVAGDLSLGMVRAVPKGHTTDLGINLDAQVLPFPDGSFDVVMANHMLYHVPDIDAALSEFRRVLKQGGKLIAATNSELNQHEFDQIMRRVLTLIGAQPNEIEKSLMPVSAPFQLENGTRHLSRHFPAVVRYDLPGAFIFPNKQPVIDYFNSMRTLLEPTLPAKVTWNDFINRFGDQVGRLITHFGGELVVNKLSGVLIATEAGGFIQQYHDIQTRLQAEDARK